MEVSEPINYRLINPRCSCFNLRRATRAVTQIYDRLLEPAGLRATQFTLLVSMASTAAPTLTDMAHSLVMDRTTLTRNLKPLEKMGFIESSVPRDKRSKAYSLTAKGRETLALGLPLWQKAQSKVMTALGQDHYELLLKELDYVTKSVGEK